MTISLDGEEIPEHLSATRKCNEKNGLTIGCSKPSECVYCQMVFYGLTIYDDEGTTLARYEPTLLDLVNREIRDLSNNGYTALPFGCNDYVEHKEGE